MKRNRQIRAYFIMRKIAKKMAQRMGNSLPSDDIDFLLDTRNQYLDHVGSVDDYIRRFDLMSIIV